MTKFQKFLIILFVTCYSLLAAASVDAATLYFSPSSGSYTLGQSFNAAVYVSSSGATMNAASGVISFPNNKLEVVSISKTGSIMSLWIQEPSFSNSAGTVDFEGIVLNPGFSGSSGKIITIQFRTKTEGSALVSFSIGSVLANDGQGTNILSTLGSANYSITRSKTTTSVIAINTLVAPQIISSTHPDPEKWYQSTIAKFSWKAPDGITATRLLIGKRPTSIPTVYYSGAITQKTIDDLEDGVWYFHAQLKNEFGWGSVAHFKLQVDTTPPASFEIKFIRDVKETDNPRPAVFFTVSDSVSGIDFYKIKIDGDEFVEVKKDISSDNPYIIPFQKPGEHTILVKAYDKAGNYTTSSEEFVIVPIDTPLITDYPSELDAGEILIIKGETYSNSVITMSLEDDKGEIFSQEMKSSQDGSFSLVWEEKLRGGIYKFSIIVTDDRGAKSEPTDTFVISVKQLPFFGISLTTTSYLMILMILIGLILLIIIMIWYTRYRVNLLKRELMKETKDVDRGIDKVFNLLRDDMLSHIRTLKKAKTKRELTKEEKKILEGLIKNFDDAEKFLKKEMSDVKRLLVKHE